MSLRLLRRAPGRAVVVVAMTFGFVGTAASVASASGGNNCTVNANTGNDAANTYTNSASPSATIQHALNEQAASLTTGTVHVAAGTYVEQLTLTTANNGVAIKGAGPTSSLIEAPASLTSDSDTDSSNPQFAMIDVQPGTTGVKFQRLGLNGFTASSFLDTDGNGCCQDYVGIYYHEASGSIKQGVGHGIDMPADLYGCQGGQGIYVNSDWPTRPR